MTLLAAGSHAAGSRRHRLRAALLAGALLPVVPVLLAQPAAAATAVEQAQGRADAAARELAQAQTANARAERRVEAVAARVTVARARLDGLQGVLRDLAVERYLRGLRTPDGMSTSTDDAAAVRRAGVLAGAVVDDDVGALDRYRDLLDDLARDQAELRVQRRKAGAAVTAVRQRAAAASREVATLAAAEAARAAAARRAAAVAAAKASPSRPRPAAAPATPSAPSARPTGQVVTGGGSWVCPVQGPRAFTDDYGDSRNGGTRRHQGNDILAPRGTPVVAPVDGSVRRHDNRLGGIAFYLQGADGNTYYGAHLDDYAGAGGRIAQGTVIGWVGNTGDARSGPNHLHFEIHPGGGGPVNPYPTLRAHC